MTRPGSFLTTITLILILVGQPVGSQEPVPVGAEGQVNTYTTDSQSEPAVAVDDAGNFVVVWSSDGSWGSDIDWNSIQGRIFYSNGFPAGPQDQVNTFTTSLQSQPAVAADADGDFVVVWTSFDEYGEEFGIRGQRYGSDGLPAGGEFQANTYITDYQTNPAVAMNTDGDFVVVWQSYGSGDDDSSDYSIQGQRYAADGTPAGEEFQVNSYTTGDQVHPAVGMSADGDFVVVWRSDMSGGGDFDGTSIQGRIFSSSGAPVTPQAQVNNYTTGNQELPAVGVHGEGNFVVVWRSYGSNGDDSSYTSIQGRIYASNGAPIGLQDQVNTYTSSYQSSPAVAVNGDGNFVVVWKSHGSHGDDSSGTSIQGQLYSSNAAPVGAEFQVNTYTTGTQSNPAVGFDAEGRFVVAWESGGSSADDDSGTSIQGQRFAIPLFADGFETGDTSRWSSSVP
jgi:hypothetical protein